jgi:hypothetical protein
MMEMAAKEPNSLKRLAILCAFNGARQSCIKGRTKKPFNSLLGETHELVTSKFRLIAEQVGHHPPETAFFMDSEFFEQYSNTKNSASFNGRYLIVAPKNNMYINLKLPGGQVENYTWTIP